MGEGPAPRPVSASVRSGVSFVLTLLVVIAVGALGGYALGRYVFDRFMTADLPAARPAAPSHEVASLPAPAAAPAPVASTQPEAPAPSPSSPPARTDRAEPPAAAPSPAAASSGSPSAPAYFVQVGAFGSLERANAMAERLRQQGLPVVIETQAGNPVLYKVRVGPYSRREDAAQALRRIKPSVPDAFIP